MLGFGKVLNIDGLESRAHLYNTSINMLRGEINSENTMMHFFDAERALLLSSIKILGSDKIVCNNGFIRIVFEVLL